MSTCKILFWAILVNTIALTHAHAMAGDLKSPSLAMPAGTSEALRVRLLAALNDPECKFLEGHFINTNTTLHYGGATPSLNRLLTRLGECEGIQLTVTLTRGEPSGPSWTVTHSGWAGASNIGIQVNVAARELNLDQLVITIIGIAPAKPTEAAKPH